VDATGCVIFFTGHMRHKSWNKLIIGGLIYCNWVEKMPAVKNCQELIFKLLKI
jgi:hypothetical protein